MKAAIRPVTFQKNIFTFFICSYIIRPIRAYTSEGNTMAERVSRRYLSENIKRVTKKHIRDLTFGILFETGKQLPGLVTIGCDKEQRLDLLCARVKASEHAVIRYLYLE